jgi:hypothetical protein
MFLPSYSQSHCGTVHLSYFHTSIAVVYGSDNHMFVVIHNNLSSKSHKTCLSAYPQRPQNHPNEVATSPRTLQLPTPTP